MILIYISGIDGCGKTTQAKLLVEALNHKGLNAQYKWVRWEPLFRKLISIFRTAKVKQADNNRGNVGTENVNYSNWLNFKRNLLAKPLIRILWLFYASLDYFIDYKKRFKNISTNVVIVDRYVNDFIIDQAVNLNLPPEMSGEIKKLLFLKTFRIPDYNIIIDLPAEVGYKRKSDGTPLSYLKARERYYEALEGPNTLHLNGLLSIDTIASRIKIWVLPKLSM